MHIYYTERSVQFGKSDDRSACGVVGVVPNGGCALMGADFYLSLVGLALVDSVNTSTLFLAILILLTARRPASTAWAYATASIVSFFVFAVLLYFAAEAASELVTELALWMRRVIFTLGALFLIVLGIRRFKARKRHQMKLPRWVNLWTAIPVGVMATVGDLPNAFPLFLAVERLIQAPLDTPTVFGILVGYTAIYALPTLILLSIGLIFADRMRERLQRVYDRFATGYTTPSWKIATLYFAGAGICIALLFLFAL